MALFPAITEAWGVFAQDQTRKEIKGCELFVRKVRNIGKKGWSVFLLSK